MPTTKTQKIVFSLLMAFLMVYGMEVYNRLLAGKMTLSSFVIPPLEMLGLMAAVLFLQELMAGRVARKVAFRIVNPATAKRLKVIVAVQIVTVCIMCPMMSFVATLAFKADIVRPLPLKWIQTVAFNLPMAMAWQLFVAGPLVRGVVKRIKT